MYFRHVTDSTTGEVIGFGYSDLRKDQGYIQAYTLWLRLFLTAALPFSLMLFFNLKILIYYKRNR